MESERERERVEGGKKACRDELEICRKKGVGKGILLQLYERGTERKTTYDYYSEKESKNKAVKHFFSPKL